MNKLDQLFENKKNNILSIYFTAGYPHLNDFPGIISKLELAGADLIEIGVPFSDPLADGTTIQQCNLKAISNGMTLDLLFSRLKMLNPKPKIPMVIMSYLNPILKYGIESFCISCQEAGISGAIIPDLPPDIFEVKYKVAFSKYHIHNIFLITPQSSEKRIKDIDDRSTSFIYFVADKGITGTSSTFSANRQTYLSRIHSLGLKSPVLAGFGISTNKDLSIVHQYVNGGIIGSEFLRYINQNTTDQASITKFIHDIKT